MCIRDRYYLEFCAKQDDIEGSFTVWAGKDGENITQIINLINLDTNLNCPVNAFTIGAANLGNGPLGTIYFDDYALDDSYLGPV